MNKPRKPYKDFPLYAHASGYWAKRINGQIKYFGKWSTVTWKEALEQYQKTKDALYAGRDPEDYSSGLGMYDLTQFFLVAKENAMLSGELSMRSFNDYKRTCVHLCDKIGDNRSVVSLAPTDFDELRLSMSKRLGKVALGNEISRIRTVFKYGFESGLIKVPVRFGPTFRRPSKRQIRVERNSKHQKLFSASEINTLLDNATEPLKTMILLGINCALGNADCGRLEKSNIDLKSKWLDFPRPKTGIERRSKLWKETADGLRLASRNSRSNLVFETRFGNSYFNDSGDNPIAKEFKKLMENTNTWNTGRGFYALRHTFETEAGGVRDQPAVDCVMGHEPQHMSSQYRHGIHDERLAIIGEHMYRWLFGEKAYKQAYSPKKKKSKKKKKH